MWPAKPEVDSAQRLTGTTNSATSAPAAFSPDDQHVELFYRVDDGTLANKTRTTGWGWFDEIRFPANLSSAPAATTFAGGLDVVVYRGTNGHLWLMERDRRTDSAATWQLPEDLGGVALRSSPGISAKSTPYYLVV